MKLYFDTRPEWIEALRAWGASDPRIAAIWIFGSRATGARTRKMAPSSVPDLDVGYTLTDADEDEVALAMFDTRRTGERLQAVIGVPLDLQPANPATDTRVWPAILDHGVLIYQREG